MVQKQRQSLLAYAICGCCAVLLTSCCRVTAWVASSSMATGGRTTLRGGARHPRTQVAAQKGDLGEFDFGEYDLGSSSGVLEADEEKIELSAPEAEVFARRKTGLWECSNCGWKYNPSEGFGAIPPDTLFQDLPANFRCPECMVSKDKFQEEFEEIAGFAENQGFGLGFNTMTAGQKNVWIWGGLGLAFLAFLGGYFID
mmetsp:Transcript_74046/g.176304  ORF Transcript_74046/g.176304 Transcript_74046/m.176304 type:complete len:199 (-) Transcript_74046:127-723(-)